MFRLPAAKMLGAAKARTEPAAKNLWERGKHGWPKSFPLVQFPNAPLLVGLAALLVAGITEGSVHNYARATFYAALAVWAWGELTAGVNWVRRILGAVGFIYVVMKVAEAL